jgi:aryl-alcohol dehydrogenase-like predicted oxidoreductase
MIMAELATTTLGNTDLVTTTFGLGCGPIAKRSFATGVATVQRALELGVRYFDTSPLYGKGVSQAIVGTALLDRDEDFLLATKLGHYTTLSHFRSVDAIRAQLDENLRLLRRDRVNVLQIHEADWHRWWSDEPCDDYPLQDGVDYNFPDAPVMRVLAEAKEQGRCDAIGITGNTAAGTARVLQHVDVDTYLLAMSYNPVERPAKKQVATILGGVLNAGNLSERNDEWFVSPPEWMTPEIESPLKGLYQLASDTGLSLVALALRFVMADPAVTIVLLGAETPEHVEQNVEAASAGPLPPDLHQAVEDLVQST